MTSGSDLAPEQARPARLLVLTFAILFLEMAVIRWLNGSVPVLAYFNNIVLISCFFGLGLGCRLARRPRALIVAAPPLLLALTVAVLLLDRFGVHVSYREDVIFADSMSFYTEGLLRVPVSVLAAFGLGTALFVTLGQELGRRLDAFADPLRAYAWDIAGSIAGTLGFAALSWLGAPPVVWFAIGAGLLLLFVAPRGRATLAAATVLVAAALGAIWSASGEARWSPYYRVETNQYRDAANRSLGFMIAVDGVRIQDALDFGPALEASPLRGWVPYYELPYHFVRPGRVLILGAGSGNEAFVARQHGAQEVDAVEIDPVLASLGRTVHPERPYALDGVRAIVDDARAHVARSQGGYDLIVMSALDSHRQIAGMSSLRLESFVYTVESYRRIKDLLAPEGVFCLNLSSTRPWMGARTYWSLAEAFGAPPRRFASVDSPFGSVAYVYGPAEVLARDLLPGATPLRELGPEPTPRTAIDLCTDDWPFLYLARPTIPGMPVAVLTIAVVLAFLSVFAADRESRRPDLHFFFLGAGFMLLETRSVTQLSLLHGATWLVNAVVFASVLGAILLANHAVRRGRAPGPRPSVVLLLVTLLACWAFPWGRLLELHPAARLLCEAVMVGAPVTWAAFIFSHSFRASAQPDRAFGSNLLGVVVGGALEYTGNLLGLRALYLVAALLYVLAAAFAPRLVAKVAPASPAP